MSDFFFRTSDLSVGYGGRTLIHDIEISVRAGEILTLIGPNGSGIHHPQEHHPPAAHDRRPGVHGRE